MRVQDVMTRDPFVVAPALSLREAARRMDELNVGALPACDGRKLVGIITDRDITVRATAAGKAPDVTHVGDVMTGNLRYCFDDVPVEQAKQILQDVQFVAYRSLITSAIW